MFGQNPLRKQELDPNGILAVQSIFPTIQGEGPNAGLPAMFIRVAGCTLRCFWCDTDFESNIGNRIRPDEIMNYREWSNLPVYSLTVITGGEPFRQNIAPLISMLTEACHPVQIETAGTHWFHELWAPECEVLLRSNKLQIVCSPKTGKVHPKIDEFCNEWKYIVRAEDPYEEITGLPDAVTQRSKYDRSMWSSKPLFYPTRREQTRIWVQPCDEQDPAKNKANRDRCIYLSMRYGYRISLQQHKILSIE